MFEYLRNPRIYIGITIALIMLSCSEQKEVVEPEIQLKTGAIKQIIHNSAECNGNSIFNANLRIIERGVCWNTKRNPTIENFHSLSNTDSSSFNCVLEGLVANTIYFARAFIVTDQSVIYGSEMEFKTSEELELVFDEYTDTRDGQVYEIVSIGNQTWFTENLNYEIENSWSYDENADFGNTYGKLYLWETAKEVCPTGWHLPTDDEWIQLELFLGMNPEEIKLVDDIRGANIVEKMKSEEGWGNSGNGNNSSGFNVLPGGSRCEHGHFAGVEVFARFWTASPNGDTRAWMRMFSSDDEQVIRGRMPSISAVSVRCVRNAN